MAGNALVPGAPFLVMGVGRCVFHLLLVARHAGVVGLFLGLEPVAAARGVAGDAVELSGLRTGTHQPGGVGVVLPQVAAVGVEVGVLQGRQIEVVEETITRRKGGGDRGHLRVADGARGVLLLGA